MKKPLPTGRELRAALLARCDEFCARHNIGVSGLAKQLTNNPAFLTWLRDGGNITLATYDKVMAKLVKLEREREPKTKRIRPTSPRPTNPQTSGDTNDRDAAECD